MSKSTISTFQLFEMFPDAESARLYLESRLWPDGVICPACKAGERITTRRGGFYRCNACQVDFTIRTGTIFERSHIPLHKWLYAMYLLVTARKGISSLQLAKEIGVTQKSAWFMLHRLREACGGAKLAKLRGIVELDECFIGGKEANKHAHKKLRMGRGSVGKTAVLGMRERGGRVIATTMEMRSLRAVTEHIHNNVELGSQLYSDDHIVFSDLDGLFFRHEAVNHSAGEYARGAASTNSIESVWAVLKRGVYGVYHKVTPKHLSRYLNEFSFRLNEGNVKRHSLERLDSMVAAIAGKRLTFKELTA
ncbi:MAG TPA: IS1595 family transposase [Terriglobales bacterium]|nr:IS1595 family transposase [Terriglobales bacterium]